MTDFERALRPLIERVVREVLSERDKPASDAHLTVAEYARRYSISQSTVRAAIREKRLEHTRIGRAVRIPADARISSSSVDDARAAARLKLLGGGKVR